MKGTLLDSQPSDARDETRSPLLILVGVLAAVLVTGAVFAGYSQLRKRHQQQTLSAVKAEQPPPSAPKGPVMAQILVDEATLKGDQTIVGGTVKNVSGENLNGLTVDLELIKRMKGGSERRLVAVEPAQLAPQQEGRYTLQLRSADYGLVRLVGLKSANSTALGYTSAPGQKRPPEKVESKTIVVARPAPKPGEFLNTPDNPGRIR
jgi:hypothetical protein